MLAAICQVLNECTKPDQASPAAIVLQGLHALCEAEVRLNWLVPVFCVLRFAFCLWIVDLLVFFLRVRWIVAALFFFLTSLMPLFQCH